MDCATCQSDKRRDQNGVQNPLAIIIQMSSEQKRTTVRTHAHNALTLLEPSRIFAVGFVKLHLTARFAELGTENRRRANGLALAQPTALAQTPQNGVWRMFLSRLVLHGTLCGRHPACAPAHERAHPQKKKVRELLRLLCSIRANVSERAHEDERRPGSGRSACALVFNALLIDDYV